MRGAIVGFGFIAAKGHVPFYERAVRDGALEIAAIADSCPARLAKARQAFPNAKVYADGLDLIYREGSQIDFLDIATPPYAHERLAVAALEAGIHVLCEKPLTTSVESARLMLEAALRNKRVLFPGHNYRHAPVVQQIKSILDTGDLGTVKLVTLQTYRNTHALGVPEWNTDWRRDQRFSGGGIAMDHGSHSFYLIFDWLKQYPKNISARMYQISAPEFDTEDNFHASLEFEGAVAQIGLTWTAGSRKVVYTIQCEKGAIRVEDDDFEVARKFARKDENISHAAEWAIERFTLPSHWMDSSHSEWFASLFADFCVAIENNQFVSKDTTDSYECIRTIYGAYESARLGGTKVALFDVDRADRPRLSPSLTL